jgi:hypothetical protein
VPKKSKPAKGGRPQGPLYKSKPPKGVASALRADDGRPQGLEPQARRYNDNIGQPVLPAHFALREDGSIVPAAQDLLPAGEGIVNPARRKSETVSIR